MTNIQHIPVAFVNSYLVTANLDGSLPFKSRVLAKLVEISDECMDGKLLREIANNHNNAPELLAALKFFVEEWPKRNGDIDVAYSHALQVIAEADGKK